MKTGIEYIKSLALPAYAEQLTLRLLEYGVFDYHWESSKYLDQSTNSYKYQSLLVLWGNGVRLVMQAEDATANVASIRTEVYNGDGHNAKRTYSSTEVTKVTEGPILISEGTFRKVLLELDRTDSPIVKHMVLGMGCLNAEYLYYLNDALLESSKSADKKASDARRESEKREAELQRKIESLELQVFKLSK